MIRRLVCAVLLLALAGPAAADAAQPRRDASYKGRTSQNAAVTLETSGGAVGAMSTKLRSQCGKGKRLTQVALGVFLDVSAGGSFSDTRIDATRDDLDEGPTGVFEVTKYTLEARFETATLARGTWRAQTVVLDLATFPASTAPFDTCDSGAVTWTARHRRKRARASQDAQNPPRMPSTTKGSKRCKDARRYGYSFRVYIVRGARRVSCRRATRIVATKPPTNVKGWQYFDWTKGGNRPWSDVYYRRDRKAVIGAIIRA